MKNNKKVKNMVGTLDMDYLEEGKQGVVILWKDGTITTAYDKEELVVSELPILRLWELDDTCDCTKLRVWIDNHIEVFQRLFDAYEEVEQNDDDLGSIDFEVDVLFSECLPSRPLSKEGILEKMRHFSGTAQWYRHFLDGLYTDGIKWLADQCGAYWLLDAIFSYGTTGSFELWKLVKHEDCSATLTMTDDANQPEKIKQKIEYTNFPLDEIKLYKCSNVLMLTGEY